MLELWEQDRGINMKKLWIVLMLLMLSVAPARAADVTLTWDAPTTNVDGSCITDHAGFKVYWGTSSGNYSDVNDLGDIACTDTGTDAGTGCGNLMQCSFVVPDLADGNWFFTVTSYDTTGNESDYAVECSKLIDSIKPSPPSGFRCSF